MILPLSLKACCNKNADKISMPLDDVIKLNREEEKKQNFQRLIVDSSKVLGKQLEFKKGISPMNRPPLSLKVQAQLNTEQLLDDVVAKRTHQWDSFQCVGSGTQGWLESSDNSLLVAFQDSSSDSTEDLSEALRCYLPKKEQISLPKGEDVLMYTDEDQIHMTNPIVGLTQKMQQQFNKLEYKRHTR
ncbi:hypothetical protein A6R68_03856, partial [Neotoma lepida]